MLKYNQGGDLMKQSQSKQPEWYWTHRLHDANIISATLKQSDWNTDDNCLILKIDGDGAMFESDITEIRFYNFKIKTNDFDLSLLNGGWWLWDELQEKGNRYSMLLKFDTAKCKTKVLEFTFYRAEVIRE